MEGEGGGGRGEIKAHLLQNAGIGSTSHTPTSSSSALLSSVTFFRSSSNCAGNNTTIKTHVHTPMGVVGVVGVGGPIFYLAVSGRR